MMLSTDSRSESFSITGRASANFVPPKMKVDGLSGFWNTWDKVFTSRSIKRPAADGRTGVNPTRDACDRWDEPNASLTNRSNCGASALIRGDSACSSGVFFACSPGKSLTFLSSIASPSPRAAIAFAECFPAGVVALLPGDGRTVLPALMASKTVDVLGNPKGRIDVLAFIGSEQAANAILGAHPTPSFVHKILGLGAKNAAVVLAGADVPTVATKLVKGALGFNGQRCTALKIFFVHESIAGEFLARLGEAVNALPFGMPWQPQVRITPLPEPDKAARLKAYVDEAAAKGARVINPGGGTACESFYFPSVVYPIPADTELYHEEQFGPVVPVCSYRDEREFFDFVTQSKYGQQVSLFGRDPDKIGTLIDKLANQVCRINLNSQCQRGPDSLPFTGRKDSAESTLSITDALRAFSIRTLVAAESNPANRDLIQNIVNGRRSSFLNTDFIL